MRIMDKSQLTIGQEVWGYQRLRLNKVSTFSKIPSYMHPSYNGVISTTFDGSLEIYDYLWFDNKKEAEDHLIEEIEYYINEVNNACQMEIETLNKEIDNLRISAKVEAKALNDQKESILYQRELEEAMKKRGINSKFPPPDLPRHLKRNREIRKSLKGVE